MEKLFIIGLCLSPFFLAAQNVGIGTSTPTAKLHVNGSVKLEGLNLFEFGAGVAGKEVNAGKVGYNAFGQNALTFVGAGTSSSNRAFYFFGEGGTTFSGPATITGNTNIGGQLQVNGTPGTAGQVLTSNGIANPTWANTAYGNNTRFAYGISQFSPATATTSTGGQFTFGTAKYNLDPASVSVSGTTLTISKTGLYHFELFYNVQFFYASSSTSISPLHTNYIIINYAGSFNPSLAYDQEIRRESTTSNAWHYNGKASLDVYVEAPRTIGINSIFTKLAGPTNSVIQDGLFYGHLISE